MPRLSVLAQLHLKLRDPFPSLRQVGITFRANGIYRTDLRQIQPQPWYICALDGPLAPGADAGDRGSIAGVLRGPAAGELAAETARMRGV